MNTDITARNFEWADEMADWAVEHAAELESLDAQFRARALAHSVECSSVDAAAQTTQMEAA